MCGITTHNNYLLNKTTTFTNQIRLVLDNINVTNKIKLMEYKEKDYEQEQALLDKEALILLWLISGGN